MSGKIVLTSQGFYGDTIYPLVQQLLKGRCVNRAIIVTTAADERHRDRFNVSDRETLLKLGFSRVDYWDLEEQDSSSIGNSDLIYVCGGDTFRLLKAARKTNLKGYIENTLSKNGMYIGVSCGSLIIGPTVQLASIFTDDNANIGLTDLSGLSLIPHVIMPHYDLTCEIGLINYEADTGIKVIRLKDGDSITLDYSPFDDQRMNKL